VKYCITENN